MLVKFVLFRLDNVSVPISSDQGTEFWSNTTLPLNVIRKSEVFYITNVSDI